MKKVVVIPTYNEAENVKNMAEAIFKYVPDTDILFVDDNSPDGTGAIINEMCGEDKRIKILNRPGKQGLGAAYVDGFKWAKDNSYDFIAQMDCDFSHNPMYLMDLFKYINEYDFVIGSRYTEGGGTKNWPLIRKIISSGGNLYARLILLSPIKDLTGGFACWRANVLDAIDLNSVQAGGFVFQVEMKYRAHERGFCHKEVPIIFEDRKEGTSKMNKKIFIEGFIRVLLLRFGK